VLGAVSQERETTAVVVEAPEAQESFLATSGVEIEREAEEEKTEAGETRLFYRIVDPSGEEGEKEHELPLPLLKGQRLLEMFKKLPSGHYRVYLQQGRTIRRLYDLHVRGNDVVTPEDRQGEPEARDGAQLGTPPAGQRVVGHPATDAGRFGSGVHVSPRGQDTPPVAPPAGIEASRAEGAEREGPKAPPSPAAEYRGQDNVPAALSALRGSSVGEAFLIASGFAVRSIRRRWDELVDEAMKSPSGSLSKAARIVRRLRM
jgi:hypothetical protein